MRTRKSFLIVSLCLALGAREAFGDEPACPDPGCHIKSPSTLTTQKGSVLTLPPGYFLDEPTWLKRDKDLKAAQDAATRLKAENESFRKSASSSSVWVPIAGAVTTLASALILHYL